MTYASHAQVITGIIQANLIHLSIKMTTPHQSGAPFVGERVFQNRGVCGQAFPSFPSPTPFLQPFCSRPIFRAISMRKTNTRCPNFVRFVRERLLRRLRKCLYTIVICAAQQINYLRGLMHAAHGRHTKVISKINEGLRTAAAARQFKNLLYRNTAGQFSYLIWS